MRHYPLMRTVATRFLEDPEDVSDVLQDAAVSLWQHADTLETAANRKAYILTTLRNLCLSRLKSKRMDIDIEDAPEIAEEDDDMRDIESRDTLAVLLSKLSPTQQAVMSISICSGLDTEAIARNLGLSADNVRQIISRARRSLRQHYRLLFQSRQN